jgi:hypothetical protein
VARIDFVLDKFQALGSMLTTISIPLDSTASPRLKFKI